MFALFFLFLSAPSSLALGGHASFLGTQYLHGAMCLIKEINRGGGIHHRRIRVIAYDDGYDPPRCVANTKRLIERDKVFCLFCYVGTPTSLKIIDSVEEAKIPLLGLFTGADKLVQELGDAGEGVGRTELCKF